MKYLVKAHKMTKYKKQNFQSGKNPKITTKVIPKTFFRRRQMSSSSDQQTIQLETSQSSNYLSSRYFDNPLTAVTSAMLHISGNGQSQNDEDSNNNNNNSITNNINLNALQSNITHQIHQVHNGNGTTSYEYYKIADKDGLQWTR